MIKTPAKLGPPNPKPDHRQGEKSGHGSRFQKTKGFESSEGVPILTYGPNTNFYKFKEKLSRAALKEYGDLARLIELMEYWEPDEVNSDQYDLEDDPHGPNLFRYKEAVKSRNTLIKKWQKIAQGSMASSNQSCLLKA